MNSKIANGLVVGAQLMLSLAFLFFGIMKLITPYAQLSEDPNMGWIFDFSPTGVLVIASAEFLLALALGLSLILLPLKKWTSIFAMGLFVIMAGAAVTHIGRSEPLAPNIVLAALAAFVAFARRDRLKSK